MNLKLTHTEGDVEFVRAEDVEIGADLDQRAYWLALKMPDGWVDYIRAVRSVERMPETPFHYSHTPNAGIWTDDLVAATPCTGDFGTCFVDDGECMECSKRDCPHHDPLHYHHDGCPSCHTDGPEPEPNEPFDWDDPDMDIPPQRPNTGEELDWLLDAMKPPTPIGDRIRRSLGERMSDHYRSELPPYEELQLKCKLLDEKCEQLKKQRDAERERVAILRRLLINRINRGR